MTKVHNPNHRNYDSGTVDDLAALVRQLAHSLKKSSLDNDLADKAVDYLRRKGLQGSPLRGLVEIKPAPLKPSICDEHF